MAEIGTILFILTIWFIIPYLLGTWLFNKMKKRWKILANEKGPARVTNYGVFLGCALIGWVVEMLILTGIKMIL
jgi:hypothetical protein